MPEVYLPWADPGSATNPSNEVQVLLCADVIVKNGDTMTAYFGILMDVTDADFLT